tara:strand:- start:2925 stop:4253 length:1329 start_codon:yes stop_codon:yes gene_type:complete
MKRGAPSSQSEQPKKRKTYHRAAKPTSFNSEHFGDDNESLDPDYVPFVPERPKGPIIRFMGVSAGYVKKAVVAGARTPKRNMMRGKTVVSSSPFGRSTPGKELSSTLFSPETKAPYKVSRKIIVDGRDVAIYLPESMVGERKRLSVPQLSQEKLDALAKLSIKQDELENSFERIITREELKAAQAEKASAILNHESTRKPQQAGVMGAQSNNAATEAGLDLQAAAIYAGFNDQNIMHWSHFIAHSLIGNKGQNIKNFCLATKSCNGEMTLIEPVLARLLEISNGPDALKITITPTYCAGYEKIRLLDRLTYKIEGLKYTDKAQKQINPNYHHSVTFSFDGLSLNKICENEIDMIKNLLVKTFAQDSKTISEQAKQEFDLTPRKLAPSPTSKKGQGQRELLLSPAARQTRFVRAKMKPISFPLFQEEPEGNELSPAPRNPLKK